VELQRIIGNGKMKASTNANEYSCKRSSNNESSIYLYDNHIAAQLDNKVLNIF
jgi:hypothetical protein